MHDLTLINIKRGYESTDLLICAPDYVKLGCFKELHNPTLHNLLINDTRNNNNSNQKFNWDKTKESMHSMACRCSKKSKGEGYHFFYIIHWAECWSSKNLNAFQDVHTVLPRSSKCLNADLLNCDDEQIEECSGGSDGINNYVYLYKSSIVRSISQPAIDGGVSEWSEFSECSVSCGTGTKERERACSSPVPSGSGRDCVEKLHEVAECRLDDC